MIRQWNDIKDDFNEGIILGNGASIAFHEDFSYSSLFALACDGGLISVESQKIFLELAAIDFEYVLRILAHAHFINQILEVETKKVTQAYNEIKRGLIETVRSTHVEYADIAAHLPLAFN